MSRIPFFRNRLAVICVAVGLPSTLVPGLITEVRGQVPGPESFHKQPETPMELWEVADYLVRTGQGRQAAPYLDKFMKSNPDDEVLLNIRDRYGVGSVLRLDNYPETRALAAPLASMLAAASHRNATRPERIERFIQTLTKSSEEQQYAVERLRESGPYAIPPLIRRLEEPNLSREDRSLLAYNMGRLDRSAVPALIAALNSQDGRVVSDVARVLGRIGDPRAVPYLTPLAAASPNSVVRDVARQSIAALTGRSFESQPRSPVRVLTDAARQYHLHKVAFPGDSTLIWNWDANQKVPVPQTVSRSDAEYLLGQRLVRQALKLDPANREAQVVLLSQYLEKSVERVGLKAVTTIDPTRGYAAALAVGPAVLGEILRGAIADRKPELAGVAATALGQITNQDMMSKDGRVHPLVEALSAPGRRAQFAAARALVNMQPRHAFAGSSQVVPILARFVGNQSAPRAVVIDGNTARGGQLVGHLKAIGYDGVLTRTGSEGFQAAAETADVELVIIDAHMISGAWRLIDTVSNLRADARTAGIPIYIVGPLTLQYALDSTLQNYPGVKFLVTPSTPELLKQQLGNRPSEFTEEERVAYANEAASLLARIASSPGSPFESDLRQVEPALSLALNTPATSQSVSAVMGMCPTPGPSAAWPTPCSIPLAPRLSASPRPSNLPGASSGSGLS